MRMKTPSIATPSTAHNACLIKNIDGLPYRSSVTTADALYTITIDSPTSRIVVRNSTRSDLSFLAIDVRSRRLHRVTYEKRAIACVPGSAGIKLLPAHARPGGLRWRERSAVISRTGWRHQPHEPGAARVPSGQSFTAAPD